MIILSGGVFGVLFFFFFFDSTTSIIVSSVCIHSFTPLIHE